MCLGENWFISIDMGFFGLYEPECSFSFRFGKLSDIILRILLSFLFLYYSS
jgi:hypothetical protein